MVTRHFNKSIEGGSVSYQLIASGVAGEGATSRRLLLLHGAGVAGELTWRFVIPYLNHWDEILVPDLPAMGDSVWSSSNPPGFSDYLISCKDLLRELGWLSFDLVGYSFGGLLAMQLEYHFADDFSVGSMVLIEPASLLSVDRQVLLSRASAYEAVGRDILNARGSDKPLIRFLDLVSPQRLTKTDSLTLERLRNNAFGLAAGVLAVAESLQQSPDFYVNWRPSVPGVGIVGGLSPYAMHDRHRQIARGSGEWQYESIPKADHSLVYVRPREVARLINSLYKED